MTGEEREGGRRGRRGKGRREKRGGEGREGGRRGRRGERGREKRGGEGREGGRRGRGGEGEERRDREGGKRMVNYR